MFSLSILRILIICEPLLCLARPQYFCCLPCPLTNDCENPYYRETSIPFREEPPSFHRPSNGNSGAGGRGDGFLPQLPQVPALPMLPPLPPARVQGPDPKAIPINLTIKCGNEKEPTPEYNNGDWSRGSLPDGNSCWVLQCVGNDKDPNKSGGSPPRNSQYSPQYDYPQNEPQQPPQRPQNGPLPNGPSPKGPPPEEPEDEPPNRHSGYSSHPERKRNKFFTNLFTFPGQLADSLLSPLSGEITLS